jgi:uroporphyrinogen decarboxylase
MSNEKFKNALELKAQKVPPVWMMRQAGRYHQHYQKLRARYSFVELCKKPEVAAEVALGPVDDFDFDVSILFSDLLFPLETLGMGLEYTDAGPRLGFSLTPETISRLGSVENAIRDLSFQGEAVERTRALLPESKSLIGFVGGPWTLFVYAVEGGHSGNLIQSKTSEALFHAFCEKMVPLLKQNIALQLKAGCERVMIFDTAAGELAPGHYQRLAAPYLKTLFEAFPKQVGYYSKGTQNAHFSGGLLRTPELAGAGFDHRWDLATLLKERSTIGFTQGNFDQAMLFLNESDFEKETDRFFAPLLALSPEERRGWVCGLGHGVLPKTPEKNVKRFVQKVREVFA